MPAADLVRVDFALIPADPLFGAVITASQVITGEFSYNANVIDASTFPPHLSLLICTLPRASLAAVAADLTVAAAAGLPDIAALTVEPSRSGYVMLTVERTPRLMAFQEAITGIATRARAGLDGDPGGSQPIRRPFTPHISIAKIDRDDQRAAVAIGRRALGEPGVTRARALDLCDIGERSQRWDVLASFPA
jgi:2'-5' RNA ligase superfamily